MAKWRFGPEEGARITQPIIYLTGGGRHGASRERLQMWIKGMEQFVVPNTTHAMLMEEPKAVAEAIAAFLKRHPFSRTRHDAQVRTILSVLCLARGRCVAPWRKHLTPAKLTPAGADVPAVWHLGRVTGDLERIIAFYHDLLGLGSARRAGSGRGRSPSTRPSTNS